MADQPQEGAITFLTSVCARTHVHTCVCKHTDSFPHFVASVLEITLFFLLCFQKKSLHN